MTRRREQHFAPDILFDRLEGRTMAWLARVTGFSRNYIQLIRSGAKPLTRPVAERACAAMGLDFDLLFLSDEPRKGGSMPPIHVSKAAD